MNQNIKVGDRVTIVTARYRAHPSRMRGATGTVSSIGDQIWVVVDHPPVGEAAVWPFHANELRVDFTFSNTKFYRVGETETHGLAEGLLEAYNMAKDMGHPVQVFRIGDNQVMATIVAGEG